MMKDEILGNAFLQIITLLLHLLL